MNLIDLLIDKAKSANYLIIYPPEQQEEKEGIMESKKFLIRLDDDIVAYLDKMKGNTYAEKIRFLIRVGIHCLEVTIPKGKQGEDK